MANLLSRRVRPDPFPPLDPEQLARFEARLATLAALHAAGRLESLASAFSALEPELEELEAAPSMPTALAILEEIDALRRGGSGAAKASSGGRDAEARNGVMLCYRPGRALTTGEADVASQGYFDGLDRPPIVSWLSALARPSGSAPDDFEVAILAWVPGPDVRRAMDGCSACSSGALGPVGETSPELDAQLGGLLARLSLAL